MCASRRYTCPVCFPCLLCLGLISCLTAVFSLTGACVCVFLFSLFAFHYYTSYLSCFWGLFLCLSCFRLTLESIFIVCRRRYTCLVCFPRVNYSFDFWFSCLYSECLTFGERVFNFSLYTFRRYTCLAHLDFLSCLAGRLCAGGWLDAWLCLRFQVFLSHCIVCRSCLLTWLALLLGILVWLSVSLLFKCFFYFLPNANLNFLAFLWSVSFNQFVSLTFFFASFTFCSLFQVILFSSSFASFVSLLGLPCFLASSFG